MTARMTLYKLVVLGDADVGKTALAIQLCLGCFVKTHDRTIEDSYRKKVVINGQSCMLEVLDTAGHEKYTTLQDEWIRNSEGFLLVYSISSRSSFTRIQKLYHEIQRVKELSASPPLFSGSLVATAVPEMVFPVMLVGNKSDRADRAVSKQEGHELAKILGCGFVETSAMNSVNVEKAFYDVVRLLRQIDTVHGGNGNRDSPVESRTKPLKRKCAIL